MNKQDLLPRLCVSIWKYAIVLLLFAFNVQDAKAQDTIPIVNPINNIYVENGDVVSAITFTGTAEIYHWFANGSAIGMTTTSGVNTIPAFTAINNGWGPIYTTINVVPMRVNNGMDTIPGTPMLFTIHVTGDSLNWNDSTDWRDTILPYVNPVNDKYVFHGNTVPSIIFSGDADSYTWTATGNNIGMTANSGTNTVPSFTAINTGGLLLRAVITVTPVKSILGNTVTGTPMLFSIHVTGDSLNWNDSTDWRDTILPYVNPVNDKYVFHGNTVPSIIFSGDADSYTWTATGDNIGMTANSGTNTVPSFTAINTGYTTLRTTFTVTPVKSILGNTITGTPMLFSIHVTGDSLHWNDSTDWRDTILPYVNPVNDKYVFHGNTVPSIIFSGDADSYTWTATGNNIGMTANSGTNTVPSFTAINTGYTTLRATFTVTPVKSILGNTVTGTPMLFSIHVTGDSLNWNDSTDWRDTILPYVNPVNDKYVFHGNTVPSIVFSGDADSYTWTATGDNIGMAANSGTNTVPSFTAINTGGLMLRAAITVTPVKSISGNTITGTPMLFSIHVTGDSLNWNDSTDWRDTILPYVNPVNDKYVFHGNTVPSIIFNGDADSYTWTATGDNIGMSANSGTNIVPSFTAINTGYTTLMATFAVTPVKNNINGTPMSFSIYVSPHDQDSIPGTIPVQGISVYPKSITISIGQWQNLFVFVSPYNASNRAYNYYINDPQIVSLDTAMSFYDSVFIQGLTPGTTFIVFETIEGGFRDTCWVTVINTNTHTSISGTIYLKDTVIVPSGLVFLYKETNAVYQFVDSTIIDNNGNYIFAGVRQGNYLVQALTNIPGTLPTYYGNTTVWSSASVIRVNNNNPVTGINIIVVGFDSLRGSGTISGYVGNDGKNTKSTLHKSSVADPYVDATVFLQRKENDAAHTIAITYTDKNGFFEFNHVPVGHYIIVVDIPGLDMIDNNEIDITEDGQVIENQNYIITEEGIEAEHKGATSIEQLSTEIEINLYPNPAQNVLHIQSSSVVEQITIYDINGRMIKQILFPNQDINVNDLAKGIYLVKVKTEAGDVLRKVIKE